MRGRKVLGKSLVSRNPLSEIESPFQRWATGYNEETNSEQIVPMKSRIFLLLVAFHVLAGSLIGQTAPPASTPTATQNSPAKTSAPPDGKTQAPVGTPASSTPTPAAPAPAAPAATGQAPAQPGSSAKAKSDSDESVATIVHVVNEVRVVFTVTDRHGRYIKDLTSNDFRVIDDQKPTELRSFRSETDLPLQVGLLIDASNSVRDRFKFEQEAAIEFLNSIIRPRYDKAFVVGFDVTQDVVQDFTDDTESLAVGVRSLRPGGGTAMYDALYAACRDKLLKQEQTGPVRRAIILLSDGEDNQSHVSREEAIEMAERAEAIVYTISTNISGTKGKGDKVLERIAEATGGRAFFPFQMRDVSDAFLSIQEELRSQYAVAYKPANFVADGRYRTIEILAQDKGLKVRTRKGYYAPKQ
ncbi:MAG: VWA domain-containing protein [Terriglobales bacterium]|jgi:VWFA-related protein